MLLVLKAVLLVSGLAALLFPVSRPFGIACIAVLGAMCPVPSFLVLVAGSVIFFLLRFI